MVDALDLPVHHNVAIIADGKKIAHADDEGRWVLHVGEQEILLVDLISRIDELEAWLRKIVERER